MPDIHDNSARTYCYIHFTDEEIAPVSPLSQSTLRGKEYQYNKLLINHLISKHSLDMLCALYTYCIAL